MCHKENCSGHFQWQDCTNGLLYLFVHVVSKVYKYDVQSLDLVMSFLQSFIYTFLCCKFVDTGL